jgi:hypothetical protein
MKFKQNFRVEAKKVWKPFSTKHACICGMYFLRRHFAKAERQPINSLKFIKPMVHYLVHRSSLLDFILRRRNVVHILKINVFKILLINIWMYRKITNGLECSLLYYKGLVIYLCPNAGCSNTVLLVESHIIRDALMSLFNRDTSGTQRKGNSFDGSRDQRIGEDAAD